MSFTPLRPTTSPDSSTSPTIPRTPPRRAERRKRGEYSWFYVLGGVIMLSLLCVLTFRSPLDREASRLLVVVVRSDDAAADRSLAHLIDTAVVSSLVTWKGVIFVSTTDSAKPAAQTLAAGLPGSVAVGSTDSLHDAISTANPDELFVADTLLHQDAIDLAVEMRRRGWPTRIVLDGSAGRSPDEVTSADLISVPVIDITHLRFASSTADSPGLLVYIAAAALIALAAGATWLSRHSTSTRR